MSEPVLHVEGLSVATAGGSTSRAILRDVSFTVAQGETVCIVGESGSGKSVTALTTMGLLPQGSLAVRAGRVLVAGEDVVAADEKRLRELRATRMSMVFQEPMTALNPVEPVGAQIGEVLRLHTKLGRAERRERVLEMLNAVHLPDVRHVYAAYPHQLSGGQRQRIIISMALILRPKLLIADEPTTALDVTSQKQILSLIRELQEKNDTAVMFITHDFGVVFEIADHIVVMNNGKVVETGTRAEILANPREPYTRMLVTSVPSLVPRRRTVVQGDIVLDVEKLNKTYVEKRLLRPRRTVPAAQDIDLKVRRGEIVGIVGESGSGKSTLARCIVRLVDADSGAIRICGEDILAAKGAALRKTRQNFQIIFQDPYRSLNPRKRVGDSLLEGVRNFGMPKGEAMRRVEELVRLVGLSPDVMHRYPHQFSGGQRQRICIARALAVRPDLLVADEAVSALDVSVQAQVLTLLEEIRERTGIAILFVTHDLRVAAQISDTIMVMHEGRIVEAGSAETVLTHPHHSYTRKLIDAAPGRMWDFQNCRPVAPIAPV